MIGPLQRQFTMPLIFTYGTSGDGHMSVPRTYSVLGRTSHPSASTSALELQPFSIVMGHAARHAADTRPSPLTPSSSLPISPHQETLSIHVLLC